MTWRTLGLVLLLFMGNATAATPADAFNQGAAYFNTVPQPVIDQVTATSHLPSGYSGSVPSGAQGLDAAALYANGLGDLVTPGAAKNVECMAMVDNPDIQAQLPCDAIKTINQSDKSGFLFSKNDPLLKRSKDVRADPMSIISNAGMEFNVKDIACTNGTSAVSTETVTRMCTEVAAASTGTCQPYQDVVIDHFLNFRCQQSANPLETLKCSKETTVTFTYSCSSGTLNPTTKQCEFTGIGSQVVNCSSWGGAFYTCAVPGAGRVDAMSVYQQLSSDPCYPGVYGISGSKQTIWATAGCRANFTVTGLFCASGYNYDASNQKCVKPALATPNALVVNGCSALEVKASQ